MWDEVFEFVRGQVGQVEQCRLRSSWEFDANCLDSFFRWRSAFGRVAAVLAGLLIGLVAAVGTSLLELVGVVLVASGIPLLSGVPPFSGCTRLLSPSLSSIFSRELPWILRVGQSSVDVVSV